LERVRDRRLGPGRQLAGASGRDGSQREHVGLLTTGPRMDRLTRRIAGSLVLLLVAGGLETADATVVTCRKSAGAKAAALYKSVAKTYASCSRTLAVGRTCDQGLRDAKASVALSKTRSAVLAVCDTATATGLGFASNGDLSVRVAGTAAGEGRQATDGAYGRDATVMSDTLARCAKALAAQSAKAGSLLVKPLAPGVPPCGLATPAKVDTAFTKAATSVSRSCTPADLTSLVGTDLTTYLATVRAGAQRVVNAFHPGFNPALSVVS